MEMPEILKYFLGTKRNHKVLSHDLSTHKKNGTVMPVIYVILFDHTTYCKGCHQTSSIFCNSNLSKTTKKCESLPKEQKNNVLSPRKKKKKLIAAARPPPNIFVIKWILSMHICYTHEIILLCKCDFYLRLLLFRFF